MSRIHKINANTPDATLIDRAAAVLSDGGLVIIPTETLYGIAADSANQEALARLGRLKNRPKNKPFPLIVSGNDQLSKLVVNVSKSALDLMSVHWPGPLTLIMECQTGLPPELVYKCGVAIRHSSHPVAAGLSKSLGRAITATSANLAGKPAPSSFENIDPSVFDLVDMVLDAGPCPGGQPSTIADVRSIPPVVIRRGAVSI